eukprot:ANDGO_05289.mRNA.1 MDIS1-interacting receptor like kinase 2
MKYWSISVVLSLLVILALWTRLANAASRVEDHRNIDQPAHRMRLQRRHSRNHNDDDFVGGRSGGGVVRHLRAQQEELRRDRDDPLIPGALRTWHVRRPTPREVQREQHRRDGSVRSLPLRIRDVSHLKKTFARTAVYASDRADCSALWDIYAQMGGSQWVNRTGWSAGQQAVLTSCCQLNLFGVGCTPAGRVTELSLIQNGLTGTIPLSIGFLTQMTDISFSTNNIGGPIPDSFCNLANLVNMDLSVNVINGSLPRCLGNLTNLQTIVLYFNEISGSIPDSIGSAVGLQLLNIHSNRLSGSLPASVGNILGLQEMYLDSNMLSGTLPSSLGNLSNLTNLALHSNRLTGEIPTSIGGMLSLTSLDLSMNSLSGSVPSTIGSPAKLESIRLFANALQGPIPETIGNLPLLADLTIHSNLLNGTLPQSMRLLLRLQVLDAHSNRFSGTFPFFLFALPSLSIISLQLNQFSGPVVLPSLVNTVLHSMEFQFNNLSGALPQELCQYQGLQFLYLSNNMLTGFPNCGFRSLLLLDLSSNQLRTFPFSTIGSFSSLQSLDLSYNQLSGDFPLRAFRGNLTLRSLSLAYNQFRGNFPIYPCGYFDSTLNETHLTFSQTGLSDLDLSGNEITSIPGVISALSECSVCNSAYASLSSLRISKSLLKSSYDIDIVLQNYDTCGGSIPFSQLLYLFPSLRTLDLSSNLLSNELDGLVTFLPVLSTLDLRNNPDIQLHSSFSSAVADLFVLNASTAYPFSVNMTCYLANVGGIRLLVQTDPNFYSYMNCVCRPGFFGKPPYCQYCLENAICSFSSESVVFSINPDSAWNLSGNVIAADGYYPSPNVPASAQELNIAYPAVLELCADAGTSLTPCRSSGLGTVCIAGYEGRLCARCTAGYFRSGSRCLSCPTGVSLYVFGTFVALVILAIFAWSFFVDGNASGVVKILVFFVQGLFFVKVPMPSTLYAITHSGSSFAVFSVAEPECFVSNWSFRDTYLLSTLAAVVFPIFIVFVWVAGRLFMLFSNSNWSPIRFADRCKRSSLFLASFFYMPAVRVILIPLACHKDAGDGKSYMIAEPAEQCSTQLQVVSGLAFVLYVVGLPLALATIVIRNRSALEPKDSRSRRRYVYSLLFASYHPRFLFWEIIHTVRRVLFVACFSVIPQLSAWKTLSVSCVLGFSFIAQTSCMPYRKIWNNVLEAMSLTLLLMNYASGIQSSVLGTEDADDVGVFIFVLNMILLMIILTTMAHQSILRRRDKKMKRITSDTDVDLVGYERPLLRSELGTINGTL